MAKVLHIIMIGFAACYGLALIVLLIGIFSADGGPLSGIFLIPLGLPWNRLVDMFPESLWPWLAAAAPLLNLIILWTLFRLARSREGQSG